MPGTRVRDYLAFARLLWASDDETVGEVGDVRGAALRAAGAAAAARGAQHRAAGGERARLPARSSARRCVAGGKACRPLIARDGLGPAFIEPALRFLARPRARRCGSGISCARSVRRQAGSRRSISARTDVELGDGDAVILAVPPWSRRRSVPDLDDADRVPRHRQRAFPHRSAGRLARRSSAWSTARSNGCSRFPAGCRSRSAPPTACSTCRARTLAQTIWQEVRSRDRPSRRCRRGRSCASGARPSRRRRARMPSAGREDEMEQSRPGRRLDRDRLAGDHRRCDPLRQSRGRPRATQRDQE